MVKQRMGSVDVAAEVACLREKVLGLRLANLYDLNAKVRGGGGGGGVLSGLLFAWKTRCVAATGHRTPPAASRHRHTCCQLLTTRIQHTSTRTNTPQQHTTNNHTNNQTYVLKLAKSGSEGEKVFLLLESGARFHTVQV